MHLTTNTFVFIDGHKNSHLYLNAYRHTYLCVRAPVLSKCMNMSHTHVCVYVCVCACVFFCMWSNMYFFHIAVDWLQGQYISSVTLLFQGRFFFFRFGEPITTFIWALGSLPIFSWKGLDHHTFGFRKNISFCSWGSEKRSDSGIYPAYLFYIGFVTDHVWWYWKRSKSSIIGNLSIQGLELSFEAENGLFRSAIYGIPRQLRV